MTTDDLIALIRQENAILFDLADAARAAAKLNDRIVQLLGTKGRGNDELDRVVETELHPVRERLVNQWDRYVEHASKKQEAIPK